MHNEEEVAFTMRADRHKTPLTRQFEEAVSIEVRKVDYLLNSKLEFHGSGIPRIRIEVGNKIIEEETRELLKKVKGNLVSKVIENVNSSNAESKVEVTETDVGNLQ